MTMPRPGESPSAWASMALLVLAGCSTNTPSSAPWSVFPLPRSSPHDGLAVVSQPDGYGLHIFLETDTSDSKLCKPRWIPDPARLFNGRGTAPFSSGLASRQEFFEAMRRKDVLDAVKQELELLCTARAPQARWQWVDPPRSEAEVSPVQLPALEEPELLTNPNEELKRQKALLGDDTDTDGRARL
nr:hypothetical protein [Synechococcus sp. CC9616]